LRLGDTRTSARTFSLLTPSPSPKGHQNVDDCHAAPPGGNARGARGLGCSDHHQSERQDPLQPTQPSKVVVTVLIAIGIVLAFIGSGTFVIAKRYEVPKLKAVSVALFALGVVLTLFSPKGDPNVIASALLLAIVLGIAVVVIGLIAGRIYRR